MGMGGMGGWGPASGEPMRQHNGGGMASQYGGTSLAAGGTFGGSQMAQQAMQASQGGSTGNWGSMLGSPGTLQQAQPQQMPVGNTAMGQMRQMPTMAQQPSMMPPQMAQQTQQQFGGFGGGFGGMPPWMQQQQQPNNWGHSPMAPLAGAGGVQGMAPNARPPQPMPAQIQPMPAQQPQMPAQIQPMPAQQPQQQMGQGQGQYPWQQQMQQMQPQIQNWMQQHQPQIQNFMQDKLLPWAQQRFGGQ